MVEGMEIMKANEIYRMREQREIDSIRERDRENELDKKRDSRQII